MLPILITSYGVGLGIEMTFSVIRKEEVSEGYLVSGMLIALIVPLCRQWPVFAGASVAAVTSVLAHGLPLRLGLALGIALGVATAFVVERTRRQA